MILKKKGTIIIKDDVSIFHLDKIATTPFRSTKRRQVHLSPAQSTKRRWYSQQQQKSNRRGPQHQNAISQCQTVCGHTFYTPFLLFAHPLTNHHHHLKGNHLWMAPGGHPSQLYSQSINKKKNLFFEKKTPNYDTILPLTPHGVLNRPIKLRGLTHTHTQKKNQNLSNIRFGKLSHDATIRGKPSDVMTPAPFSFLFASNCIQKKKKVCSIVSDSVLPAVI